MQRVEIILCPRCRQRLRLPIESGVVKAGCPSCGQKFFRDSLRGTLSVTETKKDRRYSLFGGLAICVLLLSVFVYFNLKEDPNPIGKSPFLTSDFVFVDYQLLLDNSVRVRTGELLIDAVKDPSQRGAVQPFLDGYSSLLNHSLEMLFAPSKIPYSDILDFFPFDESSPAWVAILRGGRIRILTDFQGNVRVFLLGSDPRRSWAQDYSILRHPLGQLASSHGGPLTIQVFSYLNEYSMLRLKLFTRPYVLTMDSFLSDKVPLQIGGLARFFDEGNGLVGGRICRTDGLVLYGEKDQNLRLAGMPISIADLAVAYRAVFHAGDNEAFVSLDPHADPTKVTCNFGGFLEDTAIGTVVLNADKRFKTISTGLDPNSFDDIRGKVRKYIPSFLTSAERVVMSDFPDSERGWRGTRFWFYPDSIEIEADLSYRYGVITQARFTADAERSRDDFRSLQDFERSRREMLAPEIRANIDLLNSHYEDFSTVFEELHELDNVARLMGICAWLYRARPDWLDLDALLSVEIPVFETPRESDQMLAVSKGILSGGGSKVSRKLHSQIDVFYITDILDRSISGFFESTHGLALFLSGNKEASKNRYFGRARGLLESRGSELVRSLILTEEDLKKLVEYATSLLPLPKTERELAFGAVIYAERKKLNRLLMDIERLDERMKRVSTFERNRLVSEYNRLVDEYERARLNIERLVGNDDLIISSSISIGGGINLEPRHFKVVSRRDSPAVRSFRTQVEDGAFVSSGRASVGSSMSVRIPERFWTVNEGGAARNRSHATSEDIQYWRYFDRISRDWRDSFYESNGNIRERFFSGAEGTFFVADNRFSRRSSVLAGQLTGENQIVFRFYDRDSPVAIPVPPLWWTEN
jgi:hypothetical protein